MQLSGVTFLQTLVIKFNYCTFYSQITAPQFFQVQYSILFVCCYLSSSAEAVLLVISSDIRSGHNQATDTDTVLIYEVSTLMPILMLISVHS